MTVNIEQLKRDRKEGTPGRWVHYSKGRLERIEAKINGALICICGIHKIGSRGGKEVGCWRANARRVARLPDLEATVIAQSEEIERLREAASRLTSRPPSRSGGRLILERDVLALEDVLSNGE